MTRTLWMSLNDDDSAEALLFSVLRGVKRGMRSKVLASLLLRYLDDYAIPLGDVDKIIRCVEFYCNEGLPPKSSTAQSPMSAAERVALLAAATQNTEKKVKMAPRKASIHKGRIEDAYSAETTVNWDVNANGAVPFTAHPKASVIKREPEQPPDEPVAEEETERNPDIPKWKDENGKPIPMDKETALRFKAAAPKEYKEYLLLSLNTRA